MNTRAYNAWNERFRAIRPLLTNQEMEKDTRPSVVETLQAMHGESFAGFTFFFNAEPNADIVQFLDPKGDLVEEVQFPLLPEAQHDAGSILYACDRILLACTARRPARGSQA